MGPVAFPFRRTWLKLSLSVPLLLVSVGSTAFAAGVTVGTPGEQGGCYPFQCFASDGGTRYQQQFSAASFSGALDISQFSIFRHAWSFDAMDPATFSVYFSTSAATLGNMAEPFSSNRGADNVLFGTYHLEGLMPETLTMVGAGSFHYDPTSGAPLLMDVIVTSDGPQVCDYCSYAQRDSGASGQIFSSYISSYPLILNDGGGMVVNFNGDFSGSTILADGGSLGGVPEPSTWILLISGGLALGLKRRHHNRTGA